MSLLLIPDALSITYSGRQLWTKSYSYLFYKARFTYAKASQHVLANPSTSFSKIFRGLFQR